MILFSNGCSFLTPRPKDGINTFTTKIIAEQYGMQLENLAMGGRGNTINNLFLEAHQKCCQPDQAQRFE